MKRKDKFDIFLDKASLYLSAKNLAEKWNLLSATQKKDAAELKRVLNWSIATCVQQVLLFGTNLQKEQMIGCSTNADDLDALCSDFHEEEANDD